MSLNDEQLDRYARHIILPDIGGMGQAKLLAAHVAVIGAGGIGCPALAYLAAAGVGQISIIDDDVVSRSNLQRQILFNDDQIGQSKAVCAVDAVHRLNPDCSATPIIQRLTANNADALLRDCDVVLDGCDNFATRLIVADTALTLKKPLISAALGRFDGQVATFRGWEHDKPCYRCLVGDAPGRDDINCGDQGVLGAMAGMIGAMAAIEVLRQIIGFGDDSAGKLMLFDLLSARFRTLDLPKDPGCPTCAD